MANHMPGNERSARLLKSLGFEEEGYAKEYLLINGKWEDHVLNSLLTKSNS
jgi:ribosomal-protein-alanine N-acetyltransferase